MFPTDGISIKTEPLEVGMDTESEDLENLLTVKQESDTAQLDKGFLVEKANSPPGGLPRGLPPGYVVHDITPLSSNPSIVNAPIRRVGPSKPARPDVENSTAALHCTPPSLRRRPTQPPPLKKAPHVLDAPPGEVQQDYQTMLSNSKPPVNIDRKTKCKVLLGVIEKLISNPESTEHVSQAKTVLENLRAVALPPTAEGAAVKDAPAPVATDSDLPSQAMSPPNPTQKNMQELCNKLASPPIRQVPPLPRMIQSPPMQTSLLRSSVTAQQPLLSSALTSPLKAVPPQGLATISPVLPPRLVAPAVVTPQLPPGGHQESMIVSLSDILPKEAMIRPQDITITKNENAVFGCIQINIKYSKVELQQESV